MSDEVQNLTRAYLAILALLKSAVTSEETRLIAYPLLEQLDRELDAKLRESAQDHTHERIAA